MMLRDRFVRTIGSTLLLIGAFAIGWALHHAFVVGDISLTGPPAVLAIVGGLGLVGVGWYLEKQFDPIDYVLGDQQASATEEESEPISPLTDPDLEDREE